MMDYDRRKAITTLQEARAEKADLKQQVEREIARLSGKGELTTKTEVALQEKIAVHVQGAEILRQALDVLRQHPTEG